MKIQLGVYRRIFAWTPIRFLERVADCDPSHPTYEMKTVWFTHVWVNATRANGGGATLVYKSDEVYKREWYQTVCSRIETDFTEEELQAYFKKVGVSHITHQIGEATQRIAEYVAEHGA